MKRALLGLMFTILGLFCVSQNTKVDYYNNPPFNNLYNSTGVLNSPTINTYELEEKFNTTANAACYNQYNSQFWVEFSFNQKSPVFFQNTEFDVSIDVKVEYWSKGQVGGPHGFYTTKLNLNRKNLDGNKNKYVSFYVIPNSNDYYKVKATILSGTSIPVNLNGLFNFKIVGNGKYFKNIQYSSSLFNTSPTLPHTVNSATSGLKMEWAPDPTLNVCGEYCDEYDFEWTHLDYYAYNTQLTPYLNGTSILQNNNPFSKLKYSRMTTKLPQISLLPLVYPKGFVLYRIREVYYDYLGSRREGEWHYSSLQNNPISQIVSYKNFILTIDGHESNLNWTNNLSFAENATHKSVLTYFDGSQRDRQSVTFNVSDSVPVIAETYYDKEGRKAASVLPSPELTEKTIKFYRNYNMSKVTGKPYDYDDFNDFSTCTDLPNLLDSNFGSSKYYSSNNIRKNLKFNSFIPSAGGYPLSTIEYNNDNEGRIKRQSGVGRDFQFGSGKETRYYYGKASRSEIDRLFGTDVGYNSHYFKNAVVDPNGQVSISYLDMSGKTIATALAGSAANSTIINNTNNIGNSPITYNMLEPDDFVKDLENVSSYGNMNHIVTGNQTMKFFAKANQVDYKDTCKNVTCADCYFDMNVKVTSKCIPYANDLDTTFRNYSSIPPFDLNCEQKLPVISDSFELNMPTGEYYVNATVTIPDKAIDFYTNKYLEDGACFPDLDSLIRKYKARAAPCIRNCDECIAMYGDTIAAVNKMMAQLILDGQKFDSNQDSIEIRKSLAKFASASKLGCAEYCKKILPCDVQKQLLIADVSPGGQYAMYFDTTNMAAYRDSALNSNDIVGKPKPQWKITNDGTSVFNSANFAAKGIVSISGQPFDLNTKEGLRQISDEWDESFGVKLMELHPEYCYYQYCIENDDHHAFFDDLNAIETWSEAVSKGYIPSSLSSNNFKFSSDNLVNADPYFSNSSRNGFAVKSTFESGLRGLFFRDSLNNNWSISIFDLAMIYTNPRLWTYNFSTSGGVITNVIHKFNYNYLDTCDCDGLKDQVWVQFRNLYQKIATYKYDELRDMVACPLIKPKMIGVMNEDLKNNNPFDLFFIIWGRSPSLSPNYTAKMPRFFNSLDIYNTFSSNINALIKDPSTGKYKTRADMDAEAKFKLVQQCSKNCEESSHGWIAALSNCVMDTASLRKDLIAICQSSCGDNRYGFGTKSTPYGSKISLPSKKGWASSFQEVIDLYTGSATQDIYCTSDYIYFPPYWGSDNSPYIEEEVFYQKSTCVCNSIKSFVNIDILDLSVGSTDIDDLHQSLIDKFGINDYSISSADLRVLIKQCRKKDLICIYPDKMVKLPNIFTCHNYTNCREINRAHKQFKALYPNLMVDNYPFDESNWEVAKFKKLYEGFMNHQLKMNLSFEEFKKQINKCNDCDTINCDFWKRKFFEYIELKKNYPKRVYDIISQDTSTFKQFWWYVKKIGYLSPNTSPYNNYDTFRKIIDSCITPCSNINTCFQSFLAYVQTTNPGYNINPPYDIDFMAAMAGYMNFCMFGYSQNLTIDDYREMLERCNGPMPMTISCGTLKYLIDAYNSSHKPPLDVNNPADVKKFKDWIKAKLNGSSDIDKIDFTNLFKNCLGCEIECEDIRAAVNAITPKIIVATPKSGEENLIDAELRKNLKYNNCVFRPGQILSMLNSGCFPCEMDCNEFIDVWRNHMPTPNPFPPAPPVVVPGIPPPPFTQPFIFTPIPPTAGSRGYTEDELVDIFRKAAQASGLFDDCVLDEQTIRYWAWKTNIKLKHGCPDPCSDEGCPPWTGGGGGPCCVNGIGYCCKEPPCPNPPCGINPCPNPPCETKSCCDAFKEFWAKHYDKNVFDNPITEDYFGTILNSIRTNMIFQRYNCNFGFMTNQALIDWIEKCLGKKIKFKGKEGDPDYDPGDDSNESGNGRIGVGIPSPTGGYGTGGGCCQILLKPHSITSPIWNTNVSPLKQITIDNSHASSVLNSSIDLVNINNNFHSPYFYKTILASAAPVALPPPTYPQPFDNINIDSCNKLIFDKPFAPRQQIEDSSCEKQMRNQAIASAMHELDFLRQQAVQNFRFKYINKCLSYARASLDAKGVSNEFHFTLYYYGQDGNLLRTVPPAGVTPLASSDLPTVVSSRNNIISYPPAHTLPTNYKYNSMENLIEKNTPDAGITKFVYDQLGRLILFQNSDQSVIRNNAKKYTYTLFDAQNRVYESGEIDIPSTHYALVDNYFNQNYINYTIYLADIATLKPVSTLRYITRSYYDITAFPNVAQEFDGAQENLRKRISSITIDTLDTDKGASALTYHSALHYSYDVLGNVKILVSENKTMPLLNQQFKRVNYNYDLVSGKVNQVQYQKNKPDQFLHRFLYDADNCLTKVETSLDDIHWDRDAEYDYYLHGPIARIKLGEQDLQGIDYAYTIQGWLKAVNSSTLNQNYDIGRDGDQMLAGNVNVNIARDALAFTLRYFQGDYTQIAKNTQNIEANLPSTLNSLNLYNSNLSSQTVSIKGLVQPTMAYQYRYDQLNRLLSMNAFEPIGNLSTNNLSTASNTANKYKEAISYDPNGNILTYSRNQETGQPMDQLTYNYDAVKRNQLKQVQDAIGITVNDQDIENQIFSNNYQYDNIGNLVRDLSEDLSIIWTPNGKISQIIQGNKNLKIVFNYDPLGNRISKTVYKPITSTEPKITYYSRDAQGSIMAVYDNEFVNINTTLCNYDGLEPVVIDFVNNFYSDYQNTILNPLMNDPNQIINQSKFFKVNILNQELDSCRYFMKNYLLNLCIQEPDPNQFPPLIDPNILQQIKQEVENGINSVQDLSSIVLNLKSMFPGEDPNTIEAWTTYFYQYLTFTSSNFFDSLKQQNFKYTTTIIAHTDDSLYWREQHIYGSSRLGMYMPDIEIAKIDPSYLSLSRSLYSGIRNYELTNHLGHVLVTLNDEKKQISLSGNFVDYYEPIIMTATDYYPFGMTIPGRTFSLNNNYRFGFGRKEKIEDIYDIASVLDYGSRIYDSRLGRWLSVDPAEYRMPAHSPYSFAFNNPITLIDVEGKYTKPSEILSNLGIKTDPMIAGIMDGFVSGLGIVDAAEFAYKLSTDKGFRAELVESLKVIASDPIAFAQSIAQSYIDKAKTIMNGGDKGKYELGNMIGELAGGTLSGGATMKFIGFVKKFKASKLATKVLKNKPCGCFTEETLILTKKGYKPIKDIKIGDSVWAFSDSLYKLNLQKVVQVFSKQFEQYFIVHYGNKKLRVTNEHPFFINNQWIKAQDLKVTDSLNTFDGKKIKIDSIGFVDVGEPITVYNFTVNNYHTYYVSSDNILVHNANPCKFAEKIGFDKTHPARGKFKDLHFEAMKMEADALAATGKFDEIYANRSLKTALKDDNLGEIGGWKPDVVAVNGKEITIVEVTSNSQYTKDIKVKLASIKKTLESKGYKVNTIQKDELAKDVHSKK